MTDQLLLQALQGQKTARIPIWLMRQAGRYLPEYREIRAQAGSFLNLCFHPELAAQVTLQPVTRFDLDAAIIFSDILVIPYALGQKLDFVTGEGPRLGALQKPADIEALSFSAFEKKLEPIYETLRLTRARIAPEKSVIGFAGAPWTVACYMFQGRGDGAFQSARDFAAKYPEIFDDFLDKLAMTTAQYLAAQVRAGADVLQIFDSWASLAPPEDFERFVIKPTKKIVSILKDNCPTCPIIGFPRKAGPRYVDYAEKTGVQAVSLDPAQDFSSFPETFCLQGNLDPQDLLAGGTVLEVATKKILEAAKDRPFIFNLGHGIIKETPPDHVTQLVRIVRDFTR